MIWGVPHSKKPASEYMDALNVQMMSFSDVFESVHGTKYSGTGATGFHCR